MPKYAIFIKNQKTNEGILKKHDIVYSFHHFNSSDEFFSCGWAYYGKLRLNGTIWDFISEGGLTILIRLAENETIQPQNKWQGEYSKRGDSWYS